MCQETTSRKNHPISKYSSIQVWYMKHAFQDLRISWRCIRLPKTESKKNSTYHSQVNMARSLTMQRASARTAASRTNSLNVPSVGCTETSQWMSKTFNSLYAKRKFRNKNRLSTKVKSLVKSNSSDKSSDQISSSSLAELVPCVDYDLGNLAMCTDSEVPPVGEPPSRRSSDSDSNFLSPQIQIRDSSIDLKSQFHRTGKHHRRKRSFFRAAKVAITSRGNAAGFRRQPIPTSPVSSGIGLGTSRYSLGGMSTPRTVEHRHPPTPAYPPSPAPTAGLLQTNMSRATTVTMDTSSSPCKSSTTSWLESYDMLTETLSASSWSLKTESPAREIFLDLDSPHQSKAASQEWTLDLHEDEQHDFWFDEYSREPSSPVSHPVSKKDIHRRQASAISGARLTGKDFQEAIVDIIMDNDVNDLVDLEEFLQGYFRLNDLYQDIVQQFFNDLSDDIVNPEVSRAPSVFARLAAATRSRWPSQRQAGVENCRTSYNTAYRETNPSQF